MENFAKVALFYNFRICLLKYVKGAPLFPKFATYVLWKVLVRLLMHRVFVPHGALHSQVFLELAFYL